MSKTFPASLSEYQRGARAVGAKSALPLAAMAALTSSAHAHVSVYTPTTQNVALAGSSHQQIFVDFLSGTVGYSSHSSSSFAINTIISPGYRNDPDGITANLAFNYTGGGPLGGYPGKFADQPYQTNAGYGYLGKFSRGTTIDGSLFGDPQPYLNPHSAYLAPTWSNATGYAAIQFRNNNDIFYGWLKLAINSDGSSISLLAFAYNQTPGASITAGEGLAAPVPEPATSAALLALGAAGLVAYRKQLQRAAA